MKALRSLIGLVLIFIPEGGASEILADCAVGMDAAGVLSERLTPQYMFEHMGGFDGPEDADRNRLQDVEAYDVVFSDDDAVFIVDRSDIFDTSDNKDSYNEDRDSALIEASLKDWFKKLFISKQQLEGSDHSTVNETIEKSIVISFGIGACLNYGILHECFKFPALRGIAPKINRPCISKFMRLVPMFLIIVEMAGSHITTFGSTRSFVSVCGLSPTRIKSTLRCICRAMPKKSPRLSVPTRLL
jgi:hypothetical protein